MLIRATTAAALGLSTSYYLLVDRNLIAGQPYIKVLTYPHFMAAASLAPFLIVGCGVVTASATMSARALGGRSGAGQSQHYFYPGNLGLKKDPSVCCTGFQMKGDPRAVPVFSTFGTSLLV